LIGGVRLSNACLRALCEQGNRPALMVSSSRTDASGYEDPDPLCNTYGVPLVKTADANGPGVVTLIRHLKPDLVYVIGWSRVIGPELLEIPRLGCVGIHPTLLPEGRGRAPIPWTILKDLDWTGATMFHLDEQVDHGDIVAQVSFPVAPRETALSLYRKHLAAHVELVTRQTPLLLAGTAKRIPQDESEATYWPKRTPEDGEIDWTWPLGKIDRTVRALTRPYPGAWFDTPQGQYAIWHADLLWLSGLRRQFASAEAARTP